MSNSNTTSKFKLSKELDLLLSPARIREQAAKIHHLTLEGETHFRYHPEKLENTANFVLKVIREKYPTLEIPFHSRWGHFKVGGVDRIANLSAKAGASKKDLNSDPRALIDLVVVSVLLDAGAGMAWSFKDSSTGKAFGKSEGLALASLEMFASGIFSSTGKDWRCDGKKLLTITETDIAKAFQVSEQNPLLGVSGRQHLINRLGQCLCDHPEFFPTARPSDMLDFLTPPGSQQQISALDLLKFVLVALGPIWPERLKFQNFPVGDVWIYPHLQGESPLDHLVPFHKLSQWLTYSLIEPVQTAGIKVTEVDQLTGLPEYRNGGLLLDTELITLAHPDLQTKPHKPGDEFIIEWRALTVHALDELAMIIQKDLGYTPQEFPLAKVLEGGTWWAGRKIAQQKRSDGGPPILIESDGTVF